MIKKQHKYHLDYICNNLHSRTKDKRIVLIGGSFDLIHVGHVRVLNEAKKLGNILVVALNSDAHIRTYKPATSPIMPEIERAEVVNNLKPVDYVFITEDVDQGLYDPKIYDTLQPDILVFIKEKSRYESRIKTAQKLKSRFPKLETVFLDPLPIKVSTSQIIEKILRIQDKNKL